MESATPSGIGFPPQSQVISTTELIPLPGCKSQFWRYFGFYSQGGHILESKKRVVVCKLCLREMAYSGNTSNLSSHLNSRHPREFATAKALSHVDRTTSRFVTTTNNSNSSSSVSGATVAATAVADGSFFKLPMTANARHSPNTTSVAPISANSGVTSGLSIGSESHCQSVKKEVSHITQYIEGEISNSSPTSLSASGSTTLVSHPYPSPVEEALMSIAVDLLISPRSLLNSSAFLDFCRLLDPQYNPPSQLSLTGLYNRVRDAVFPPVQRQCEETYYSLSIELDHLLHGRHGTATAQRIVLHRLDADFNVSRICLQSTLSQLHADPMAWCPHILSIVSDWDLAPSSLFGLVLAGTWVEGAEAACLDNIRSRLPQPQFLSLETSLARVIVSAAQATKSTEFITSAICAMNADSKNETANHQDNLLPEWCRLCHYLRDSPLHNIKAAQVLLAFMTPLESVYQQLRNEERVHLSVVRPLVALMEKQLAIAGDMEIDENLDWDNLRIQWTSALRAEFDSANGYLVATLLDPRFKSLPFVSESDRRNFHEQLQKKAFEEAPNVYPIVQPANNDVDSGPSAPKKSRTSTAVLLSELFSVSESLSGNIRCPTTVEDKAEREISNYLSEEDLPLDGNPLTWWRTKKGQYPLLSLLARKYFCLPGLMSHRGNFLEAQTRLPHLEESVRPMITFLKEYQEWIGILREMT